VVVVTTKPHWARTDTFQWLADVDLPTTEVHLHDRKYEVDCDAYLDDAPYVLHELVEHRPGALICRFVRPWNLPVPGVVDVGEWSEFVDLVTDRSSSRPRRRAHVSIVGSRVALDPTQPGFVRPSPIAGGPGRAGSTSS
jgi:hypothetical protein